MRNRRVLAQDAAKGIMILIVVLFHCYLLIFENTEDALGSFNIVMAIFPFLLSTFFFYSGYNYVPNKRTIKENILRRIKQLVIPLVLCYIISIVVMSSMELIFSHQDIGATFNTIGNTILYSLMSEGLAKMIGFPQSGGTFFSLVLSLGLLWFLYCLLVCSIFFYLLVGFTNKKVTHLISVVTILLIAGFCLGEFVGPYLPYTVQCYPVVLAVMLTGAYLRQSSFLNKRIRSKKESILHAINCVVAEGIIIGTCFICHYRFGAIFTGSLPGGIYDYSLRGFDAFIAFIFSIIGTYFIHTVCRLIKHIPVVSDCLTFIGNHSAIFYLFHPIFIIFAYIVFFQKRIMWGPWQAIIYFAFSTVMLTLVCLLIDFIAKRRHLAQELVEEAESRKESEDNI